jgi:hypothetical protein
VLAEWLTIGVFGQPRNGAFGRRLMALVPDVPRARLHRGASAAWSLFAEARARERDPALSAADATDQRTAMTDRIAWSMLAELSTEFLAPVCIMGLLGRAPRPAEAERLAASHSGHNGWAFISAVLNGEEFRSRPDAASAATLAAWADAASIPAENAALLPIGRRITVSTSVPETRDYMASGWHQLERDGIWSRASVAAIRFSLADDCAPQSGLQLWIQVHLAGSDATGGTIFSVQHGEATLYAGHVNGGELFDLTCPLPSECADYTLVFDCGRTIKPSSFGLGLDTRDLGFKFIALSVTRTEPIDLVV